MADVVRAESRPFTFDSSPIRLGINKQQPAPSAFTFQAFTPDQIRTWARGVYRAKYCDENGNQNRPMRVDEFLECLTKERPSEQKGIERLRDECVAVFT